MKALALRLVDAVELYPLFHRFNRGAATVFMTHHFCAAGESRPGVVSVGLLERCLGYLSDHGYAVVGLSEHVERLRHGAGSSKSVVFTVDDGYRDFYDHAYPVFVKHRAPVAVFLATGFIDGRLPLWWDQLADAVNRLEGSSAELDVGGERLRLSLVSAGDRRSAARLLVERCKELPDAARHEVIDRVLRRPARAAAPTSPALQPLTWEQIGEMRRQGVEFHPHTLTHPILARCGSEQVLREVAESRRRVQEMTGAAADVFCYPNGRASDFNAGVVEQLQAAGYRAAVTAVPGRDAPGDGVDLFRLRRYALPDRFVDFKQLVSGLEAFKDRWR